ncbi:uncharacterized protein LACBIDRAFT_310551 [Laccaria bicolor S238N-H82]|uniref:Predicted protein n=1 Tax=Laccaria bicolor (strain S238N-H82 / ATCC MYA-4686) TaxID=486041 RepID=B0DUK9_LACBS|nr:uncharacterized protein LACBIDRAFT_310551 [Laccaria bicolor S238N-H82]EDR01820.1 predicted protein [Laccaria bicolor S238N-H82]|eukprot:XP_001887633.1 predicted protein [Laccaria bicolor S238N-H82]
MDSPSKTAQRLLAVHPSFHKNGDKYELSRARFMLGHTRDPTPPRRSKIKTSGQGVSEMNHFVTCRSIWRWAAFISLTYLLDAISTLPNDCPPDQRQRTSSPSIDENSVIVRSTIWYDDGSVVLQAECTQFRVHRTLLCQNSTIFTDMFSIPQPSPEESPMEGCALVRLPDSAEEVETVLRKCPTSPPLRHT